MTDSSGVAFVDGRFCPVEEARIPVLDLAVTKGDSTYDVVHVWQGRFFRLDDHLDRFEASMKALRLDPGLDRRRIEDVLHECVSRAGLRDAYVSMTCTRGRQTVPGSRDLRTTRNGFYAYAVPFVWIATPERQERGVSLWISSRPRIAPESVDPAVKNYHWLDIQMAQFEAYDHGAELVVLRDMAGGITEGAGYNVFAYVDDRWLTPGSGVLRGITRQTVLELLADDRVEEGHLSEEALLRAEEVLVTSTAGGVMPVTEVNGRPVGSGLPGPRTRRLRESYWARHADERWTTPVRYR
ncbi:aminotransferase class IV [Saccharothrix variisporea]|uniref:Branched chain amino acid aminotransferase n=1 Tax=Saccharothrix variisporea TaxID=543527 RepID=A0A495X1S7_9PSEU|nr:aminotransferase class IV [Saccharothrix variisporea]RKT67817.1 branched chain amino acid aminotransferase [Saccharothrix variisporea]